MERDRVETFIKESPWAFAKTMPQCPHWYVVRSPKNEEAFVAFVRHIRENGVAEIHEGRTYLYFYCGDHKYWTMGNPTPETIIINRTLVVEGAGLRLTLGEPKS
jgi:hypothetical protein